MRRRRGNTDASDSWFSRKSETSGWRMQQLKKLEVMKDMESNKKTRDINPNLENSTGEDKYQCNKGWSIGERRSICYRTVFNPSWDGKMQTNYKIQGDVLVEIRDKTAMGLILPEIVYNVKGN